MFLLFPLSVYANISFCRFLIKSSFLSVPYKLKHGLFHCTLCKQTSLQQYYNIEEITNHEEIT